MPKMTFLLLFFFKPKIGFFSLKTAARAHTGLQQGKTSMNKRFPIKQYTIENFFHTILRKTDTSGMRGGTFAVFFFSTPRPARKKMFGLSATSALVLPFHQIPSCYKFSRRNERGESGTLVSTHLSVGRNVVQPSVSPLVHKCKSLKTARKTR